jgi:hypothetical protein
LEDIEKEGHFPPAMLDLGMPQEMNPVEDFIDANPDVPMVEISTPLRAGDFKEIRNEPSLTELREEGMDSI